MTEMFTLESFGHELSNEQVAQLNARVEHAEAGKDTVICIPTEIFLVLINRYKKLRYYVANTPTDFQSRGRE